MLEKLKHAVICAVYFHNMRPFLELYGRYVFFICKYAEIFDKFHNFHNISQGVV